MIKKSIINKTLKIVCAFCTFGIIILLIQACSLFESKDQMEAKYYQHLQGDWIWTDQPIDNKLIFSFYDTQCSYGYQFDYYPFEIKQDTLEIMSPVFDLRFLPGEQFKIAQISKKKLTLLPTEETRKYYKGRFGRDEQKFEFIKIPFSESKHKWDIAYEGPGEQYLETFYMEIDSSGLLKMWKFSDDQYFEGKLRGQVLLNKITQIPKGNLKKLYSSEHPHATTRSIAFMAKNEQHSTRIYGRSEEPIEFHPLFLVLENIELFSELKEMAFEGSIRDHLWAHSKYYRTILSLPSPFPPPPPPPSSEVVDD